MKIVVLTHGRVKRCFLTDIMSYNHDLMRRLIPSTHGLQAFESAARHTSFTRAAQELNITQSAVSRQIRLLEEHLGVRLFHRSKQRISITEAGEVYLADVRASLSRIEKSTRHLIAHQRGVRTLNLATLPTFGTKWLIPRLAAFRRQHPATLINFILRPEPFEFTNSEIDAAIYFGTPVWPGIVAERLIGDESIPVCSPDLLGKRSPALDLHELARHPLLQLTVPDVWNDWFQSLGAPRLASTPTSRFEHFTMGIQAAICGLGILLVPHFLVLDDIRDGRLVIAYPHVIKTRPAYHFICPDSKKDMPAVTTFRNWAVGAAQQSARECAALLHKHLTPKGRKRGGAV